MSKKMCKACLIKHGLLQNFEKFVKKECVRCGKVKLCQGGKHMVWNMKVFFDNALPKYEIKREKVHYV